MSSKKNGESVIAIFDLDRTITTHATYTAWLLRFLGRHPLRFVGVPVMLGAAIAYVLNLISRKTLKEVMLKVALRGLPAAEVDVVTAGFVADWVPRRCNPGALAAIAAHRAAGHKMVLATASNDVHAVPLARALGIGQVVATRTEVAADGSMTGRILGPNCYGADKLIMVKAAVEIPDRSAVSVAAYSDHDTDLPLLEWADKPVAVNPNAELRRLASARGIPIEDWSKPPLRESLGN